MGVIDEVKQRSDIVEVISQYVRLTKSGRTFRGLCPFHSEKNPSFFVYPEQQTWHCFGACNTGGDVYSFIMKKEAIDFGAALRLQADRAGVTISTRSEREAEGKERLYQANQAAAQYFHNLLLNLSAGEKARKYVASRGLLPKTVTDFQLGFSLNSWDALKQYLVDRGYTETELLTAGLIIETEAGRTHDRFRNWLMFPIVDARGRTTGFGARVLDDSLPKYINSPQTPIFDKSGSLYGINLATAVIRQQNQAVLVEGYMDVITAHQYGFHNVIASMGTSVTEKQLSAVKRLTRNVVLAFDPDIAGEEALWRTGETATRPSAEDLAPRRDINPDKPTPPLNEAEVRKTPIIGTRRINKDVLDANVIIMPVGKDPDEVIKDNTELWKHLLAGAVPVIDNMFDKVTSELDLTTARDKSQAVDSLLPIIAGMSDDIHRDHYLTKLTTLVGTSYRSLESALSRIKPDRKAKEPKSESVRRALQPVVSSRVEEYCLALLLQHPELKARCQDLSPKYFEDTQNREIFIAFKQADETSLIKERLDSTLYEHLDSLTTKSLPVTQIEQRYADCVLRLQEKFLRSLENKRREVLALAAESGGTTAELAKLEEQGIEISVQLGKVFARKSQTRAGTGEVRHELGR